MKRAAAYRCFDVGKVERILEVRCTRRRIEDQIADATRERIQRVMRNHPVSQRSLGSYSVLRRGDTPPADAAPPRPGTEEDDHAEPCT